MNPEQMNPGYDRDGDSDMNTGNNSATLAAGRKSAASTQKTAAQHIADAKASGECTCGATLGK